MEDRLYCLEIGGVIDSVTKDFGMNLYGEVSQKYKCVDKIETFVTHVVMAIERIKKGEIMQCDFASMIKEIKDEVGEEQLSASVELGKSMLKDSPVEFPQEEFVFLLMHLNAMMMA